MLSGWGNEIRGGFVEDVVTPDKFQQLCQAGTITELGAEERQVAGALAPAQRVKESGSLGSTMTRRTVSAVCSQGW